VGESQDRRQSWRTEVHWPVSVDNGSGPIEGQAVNVSEHGLSICCEEGLPLEEVVSISIMPPDHRIIEVSGKVTWSDLCGIDEQNKAVGLGICFLEIAESDRQFVVELIRRHAGAPG
jgi:hypothetical protein